MIEYGGHYNAMIDMFLVMKNSYQHFYQPARLCHTRCTSSSWEFKSYFFHNIVLKLELSQGVLMALLLCSAFLFLCDNLNARLMKFSISLFSCRGVSIFRYCDSEKGSKLLSFVCLSNAFLCWNLQVNTILRNWTCIFLLLCCKQLWFWREYVFLACVFLCWNLTDR